MGLVVYFVIIEVIGITRGMVVLELASVYSSVRQTTEAFDKLTFALLMNSTYLTDKVLLCCETLHI